MEAKTEYEKSYVEAVENLRNEWLVRPSTLEWYNFIVNLNDKPRIAYLIGILYAQVINGGFDQYFSNLYGQFAFDTLDALKKIGAIKHYNLVYKAIEIVNPAKYEKDIFVFNIVNGNLWVNDEMSDKLDELDTQVYENEDEDLSELFEKFAANINS